MSTSNLLLELSNGLADAAERGGAATLLVDGRARHPASGIGIAADLVLTADHVLDRDDEIRVVLPAGEELKATVAGRDPRSDLAVLRVSGGEVPVAERGDEPRVGQLVLALGRPSPGGIEASLGVISAIGGPARTGRGGVLERFIRTDTIAYPGFSGGPLVDGAGKVLGLNTSGLWGGAAVTIPAALAWQVAETLGRHGQIKRGYLGIRSQPVQLPPAQQSALGRTQAVGLLLVWIEEHSPAAQGGLLVGDILVGVAGTPLSDPDDLQAMLVGAIVGQDTPVEVLRGGQPATLQVTIGERRS